MHLKKKAKITGLRHPKIDADFFSHGPRSGYSLALFTIWCKSQRHVKDTSPIVCTEYCNTHSSIRLQIRQNVIPLSKVMVQVGEKWIRDTILYYSEFRTIFINRPWVATYEYLGWEASPVSLLASEVPEQLFLWLSFPWMGWCSLVVSGMYVRTCTCTIRSTNQRSVTWTQPRIKQKGVWFWIDVNTPLSAPYHTQTAQGGASKPSTHTTGTQLPIESNPQRTRRPTITPRTHLPIAETLSSASLLRKVH